MKNLLNRSGLVYKGQKYISQTEIDIAKILDKNEIYYLHEELRVSYVYEGESHTYIADFYLPYDKLILEVKSSKHEYTTIQNLAKQLGCKDAGYNFEFISTECELLQIINKYNLTC